MAGTAVLCFTDIVESTELLTRLPADRQPAAVALSRKTRRKILPEADFGIASTKLTFRICL
jgi:hypothetical protein